VRNPAPGASVVEYERAAADATKVQPERLLRDCSSIRSFAYVEHWDPRRARVSATEPDGHLTRVRRR
jgi:hypothetical protein